MLKTAITFCLLLASGCQLLPRSSPDTHGELVRPMDLSWLSEVSGWSGAAEHRTQLVRFEDRRSGKVHAVRYDVQLTATRIVMIAQSTLGVPLYQSIFEAGTLHTDLYSDQLQGIPTQPAMADFILANWPPSSIRPALEQVGYTLESGTGSRSLRDRDGLLQIEVSRLPGGDGQQTIRITHYDIPMTIYIQTVAIESLP